METRLSFYATGVIEAGWLLALVVVPLLFDTGTVNSFELPKPAAVRAIALVMLGAWALRILERSGSRVAPTTAPHAMRRFRAAVRTIPLAWASLPFLASLLLSAVASVTPRLSVWGSWERGQGLCTALAYLTVFWSVGLLLRHREQLDRLVTTVLLVSIPISLYGIVQWNGLDLVPWRPVVTGRVTSTLGNRDSLAGFLIMCVPITLGRLLSALGALRGEERLTPPSFLPTIGSAGVLFLQLLAILYAEGRAAWLGLLAGLAAFGFLTLLGLRPALPEGSHPPTGRDASRAVAFALAGLAGGVVPVFAAAVGLRRGLRWLWLSWVVACVLVAGFIVILNVAPGPRDRLRGMPLLGQLGHLANTNEGTSKVRLLIWEGATRLIAPHEPLWSPASGLDRLNGLRPWVGYGPETIRDVYPRFAPAELARLDPGAVDRSHNEVLDALIQTGALGLWAYAALIIGLVSCGLRSLGLVRTAEEHRGCIALSIAGGATAALGARGLDGSWRLFGVAFAAGMLLGLAVYVVGAAMRGRAEPSGGRTADRLVLIGLLSAVLAYFVDGQFGFGVTATRTYFWAFGGALVAVGRPGLGVERSFQPPSGGANPPIECARPDSPHPGAMDDSSRWTRGLLAYAAIVALALVTLGWDLQPSPVITIRDSLALWLFGATGCLATILVMGDVGPHRGGRTLTTASLCALSVLGGVALGQAAWAIRVDLATRPVVFATVMVITITALGAVLAWGEGSAGPVLRRGRVWAHGLVIASVIGLVATNVRFVQAATYQQQAALLLGLPLRPDLALAAAEKAVELSSAEDVYHSLLGTTLVRVALSGAREGGGAGNLPTPVREEAALLERAKVAFLRARELRPLLPEYTVQLAQLEQIRGRRAPNEVDRREALRRSLSLFEQASRLSPNEPRLYVEWGRSYELLGRPEEALSRYRQAQRLEALRAGSPYLSAPEASHGVAPVP